MVFLEGLELRRATRGNRTGGSFAAADNSRGWISYFIGRPRFHSRVFSARTRQRACPRARIGFRFPLGHGFNHPKASAMPITFRGKTAGYSLRTPARCVSFTHACVKFTHCSGRPHGLIARTHPGFRFRYTWATRGAYARRVCEPAGMSGRDLGRSDFSTSCFPAPGGMGRGWSRKRPLNAVRALWPWCAWAGRATAGNRARDSPCEPVEAELQLFQLIQK